MNARQRRRVRRAAERRRQHARAWLLTPHVGPAHLITKAELAGVMAKAGAAAEAIAASMAAQVRAALSSSRRYL